jgi:hypothetical protein
MSEYYTAKLSNSALASHVSIDGGAHSRWSIDAAKNL